MCQEATNPPKSITEVATNFGRVPVRMRQWTNNVVHYNSGSGAYAIGSDVVFFGNSATTAVMVHEATHCVDGGVRPSTLTRRYMLTCALGWLLQHAV